MTDLHSHILPGMDDGAPDCETAVRLLEMERIQGVDCIALTSHFNRRSSDIETYLQRRDAAARQLRQAAGETGLRLKLGAEVMYYADMMNEPVHRLCLEGTDVLLIELPVDQKPPFLLDTLNYLRSDGLIPLIAHVERYPYLRQDPRILAEWVELGALAQVNSSSLVRSGERRDAAMKFLKWNMVHVIATDTHTTDKRPPMLWEALREVQSRLGPKKADWLLQNADDLFGGSEPEFIAPHVPRRILGRWR